MRKVETQIISEMQMQNRFKVVILGETLTGKTCLIKRYLLNKYDECSVSTIGTAYNKKKFQWDEKQYDMEIWDTGGEERFRSVTSMFYRDAKAAIVCYDVTLRSSFYKLKSWIEELDKREPTCVIYICATKADLLSDFEADPSLNYAESYAREIGVKFFLTSSKTGMHITDLFHEIFLDYISNPEMIPRSISTITIHPYNRRQWEIQRKKCCSNG